MERPDWVPPAPSCACIRLMKRQSNAVCTACGKVYTDFTWSSNTEEGQVYGPMDGVSVGHHVQRGSR